jgi:uncharacterized membrane protein
MNKVRLEAFSDGVLAIVITIMVLELKTPHGDSLSALKPLIPIFLSYILSFIYIGIYWNNHHHLLHSARKVNGKILWANLHLLFWLSLVPFATSWIGESHFSSTSMVVYGVNLFCAAIAYWILQNFILQELEDSSPVKIAIGSNFKGKISPVLYIIGIAAAFYSPAISGLFYVSVALIWLVPDRRIERALIH